MFKRVSHRFQGIISSMTLMGTLAVGAPSEAREIIVNGLSCNDLCQAWLGVDKKQDITGSIAEGSRPKIKSSFRGSELAVLSPTPRVRQPGIRSAKAKPAAPIDEPSVPESPEAVVMAKHVRHRPRQANGNVPLPVPRPAISNGPPAMTTGASVPATSEPQDPPRKHVEVTAMRDVDAGPIVPDGRMPPSAPDKHDVSRIPRSQTEPSQAELPTSVTAMPSPAASPLPRTPQVAAIPQVDGGSRASRAAQAKAPMPPSVGDVDRPGPAATRLPQVVASLPSAVDGRNGFQDHGHRDENRRKGSLQPLEELAGGPSPVTIGQISSELSGTDVHIVVVNVLHHEMKDFDVLCTVRNAQGLQIAEASTHIAAIAPSDVAFRQIVLPSGIATWGNDFACRIGRLAAASDVIP